MNTILDWKKLVWLPENELCQHDIAFVNLACAAGLPGTEGVNLSFCSRKLAEWADKVQWYTGRCFRQFQKRPWEFYNSEAYYRVLALITVLQRDCGVHYNLAKIPDDVPFEVADSFIFGAIQGEGGTCATMPVIYVAVGRRLGYPLKLVCAKGKNSTHFICSLG